MRAVTVAGVVAGVLGLAAVVTLGAAPSTMADGQQASQAGQQVEKKTDPKVEKKVETKVVTVDQPGQPMVVTVETQDGAEPHVMVRQVGEPAIASFLGGGPRLGVEIRDVAKEDVATLKLTGLGGVVIGGVTKDSAAEKAGVTPNDVVVTFDGESVRSAQQFARLVRETAPGRAAKMTVVREGKRMEIEVTPGPARGEQVSVFMNENQMRGDIEQQMQDLRGRLNQYRLQRRMPARPSPGEGLPPGDVLRWKMENPTAGEAFRFFRGEGSPFEALMAPARGRLGVTVQELTPELATYFGVTDGLLVSSVAADSPAAKAGLKAGDVITAVDGKAVATAPELVDQLGEKEGEVAIGLTRDRKAMTLKATIEAAKAPGRRIVLRGTPA